MQTPAAVIKSMNSEAGFNAFGYSFINGLLNEINKKDETNKNNKDGENNE